MSAVRIVAASAILAAGLWQAGDARAHQQDVQIVRGGQPASIAEVREAGVQVFRGTPAATAVAFDRDTRDANQTVETVASGSKVWFIDRAADKLRVCRLVKTTQVGEHRIECQSRGLPI